MSHYRGRFAPTPTGPLHFGSLFAAVTSYLDAKAQQGAWLLRIEDIDSPREQPGAASAILRTLESHGLQWDETETYQSANHLRYQANLEQLHDQGRLFWCQCSRKQLIDQPIYPGHCRHQTSAIADSAIRLRVETTVDYFDDVFQGPQTANLSRDYGDVVLRRRDRLFAYQLAVVSDDIAADINRVIRGIDLLDSTFWQRELYRAFNVTPPTYGHFPVIYNHGAKQKLSKQNRAAAAQDRHAEDNLSAIFALLDIDVSRDRASNMLQQAVQNWHQRGIQNQQAIFVDDQQQDTAAKP